MIIKRLKIIIAVGDICVLALLVIPNVYAAATTFETKVKIPNMVEKRTGVPVCVDSVTGELTTGCDDETLKYVCERYITIGAILPAECRERTVFITSQDYDGALGGVAGADDKCQDAADNSGNAGTYKAWLSEAQIGPSRRFTRDGIFVSTTGEYIAFSWSELTTEELRVPIYRDEFGFNSGGRGVWTNTLPSG